MLASPTTFVGIAFRIGDPLRKAELLVMGASGGPFVHSEFFVQRGSDARFYTAVDNKQHAGGFLPTNRRLPLPRDWEIIKYPVSEHGYHVAYALVLQMLSMHLPYNSRDLWQCCFQLLLPFEKDLDWDHLGEWPDRGVFCSQACLLLLRNLCKQGALPSIPQAMAGHIASVNSRGCSPNELHQILTGRKPDPSKKKGRNIACLPATQACPSSSNTRRR